MVEKIEKFQLENISKNVLITYKIIGNLVKMEAKKMDKQGFITTIESDYNDVEIVIENMRKSIKDLWYEN